MEKKLKRMRIIRWIGIAPFVLLLIIAIISMGTGVTFIFNKCYGFDAFILTIMCIGIVGWPIFIAAAITIIITSILIRRTKKDAYKTISTKDIAT